MYNYMITSRQSGKTIKFNHTNDLIESIEQFVVDRIADTPRAYDTFRTTKIEGDQVNDYPEHDTPFFDKLKQDINSRYGEELAADTKISMRIDREYRVLRVYFHPKYSLGDIIIAVHLDD